MTCLLCASVPSSVKQWRIAKEGMRSCTCRGGGVPKHQPDAEQLDRDRGIAGLSDGRRRQQRPGRSRAAILGHRREAASQAKTRGSGEACFRQSRKGRGQRWEEVTEEWGCTRARDGERGSAGAVPGLGVTRPEGPQWDMVRRHSGVTRPVGHHPHPVARRALKLFPTAFQT